MKWLFIVALFIGTAVLADTPPKKKTGHRLGPHWDKSFIEKVQPKASATPYHPYYPSHGPYGVYP
jgi:hypothetical protein